MSDNERGMSSLSLVLALLLLGSLMLNGLQQQLNARFIHVASESQAIKGFSVALSMLAWAERQSWHTTSSWQCRQNIQLRGEACVRLDDNGSEIIVAARPAGRAPADITLWQLASIRQNASIAFSKHGWSDFCPLREVSQCQLP